MSLRCESLPNSQSTDIFPFLLCVSLVLRPNDVWDCTFVSLEWNSSAPIWMEWKRWNTDIMHTYIWMKTISQSKAMYAQVTSRCWVKLLWLKRVFHYFIRCLTVSIVKSTDSVLACDPECKVVHWNIYWSVYTWKLRQPIKRNFLSYYFFRLTFNLITSENFSNNFDKSTIKISQTLDFLV